MLAARHPGVVPGTHSNIPSRLHGVEPDECYTQEGAQEEGRKERVSTAIKIA